MFERTERGNWTQHFNCKLHDWHNINTCSVGGKFFPTRCLLKRYRKYLNCALLCHGVVGCISLNSTGTTRTRTSLLTSVRRSSCSQPAAVRAARSARRQSPRTFVDVHFSSRGCPLGMHVCTRLRVLCMINYHVHIYKITR